MFDELFFVVDEVLDFDDVVCDIVVEDFDSLWGGNILSEEFDEVVSVENSSGVEGFVSGFDGYGIFNEIECVGNVSFFEVFGDEWLCFMEINFVVFGEECYEGGFFCKSVIEIVFGCEGIDFLFVDVIGVLRFVFVVGWYGDWCGWIKVLFF